MSPNFDTSPRVFDRVAYLVYWRKASAWEGAPCESLQQNTEAGDRRVIYIPKYPTLKILFKFLIFNNDRAFRPRQKGPLRSASTTESKGKQNAKKREKENQFLTFSAPTDLRLTGEVAFSTPKFAENPENFRFSSQNGRTPGCC